MVGGVVQLVGRDHELARLTALTAAARGGTSGVLAVTGPAGIGKTTLLREALGDAAGFVVTAVEGFETEADIAYSVLHRLLMPFMPPPQPLAAPQQEALDTIFGVRPGGTPDPFLVGLAVLTVLTDAAHRAPIVCIVDDVQWIDEASLLVLTFVARRLLADPVVVVFAARPETEAQTYLSGFPTLALEALGGDERLKLVRRHAPDVGVEVAERIARESAGNPLALVEHVHGMSVEALAGEASLVAVEPLPTEVEHVFDRDIRALPEHARLLLTIAALEPSGDAELIRRSAELMGMDFDRDPERLVGRLATFEPVVRFGHPLVRSAAVRMASHRERRSIHAALASADRDGDPIRRAWHLAQAAHGPDEAVADELDEASALARTRGGQGVASDLLHRAAELTSDSVRRHDRLLRSATAAVLAGRFTRALALLPSLSSTGDRADAARVALIRATAAGVTEIRSAPGRFAEAAQALHGVDEAAARGAWQQALYAASTADGLKGTRLFDKTAVQARTAGLASGTSDTFLDLLMPALVELRIGDRSQAVHMIRSAYATQRIGLATAALGIEASFGGIAALEILDLSYGHDIRRRLLERDRGSGNLLSLRLVAMGEGLDAAITGRLVDARRFTDESAELWRAFGGDPRWETPILHALALSGHDEEVEAGCHRLIDASLEAGFLSVVSAARSARADLYLSRARYAEALAALVPDFEADPLNWGTYGLPAVVEAASRTGDEDLARRALARLRHRADAAGSPWGLGLLARSEALVTAAGDAESLYSRSITFLQEAEMPLDAARAGLLYGEWLRRARRRTDAVEQLGTAHDSFVAMGAQGYADRAQAELQAAGGHARRRSPETRDELTPRERQVAVGAASGATNREIASTMFVSEATVAYHLRKVFRKLDITGRRQLRDTDLT